MIDAPQISTCITNNFIFLFDLFNRVFGQLFFFFLQDISKN